MFNWDQLVYSNWVPSTFTNYYYPITAPGESTGDHVHRHDGGQPLSNDVSVRQLLKEPVQVLFFGQKEDCSYCEDTQSLLEELTALSDQIDLGIYDLTSDAELAQHYNVDKVPGIVIATKEGDTVVDYGIRYAGIPAGHEFSSLIQDLILVSSRDSGLSQQTRDILTKITKPVVQQVFVTPT